MRGKDFVVRLFVLWTISGCGVEDNGEPIEVLHGPGPGPDLVESAVSDPPATVSIGSTFTVSDTVENLGTVDAGASTTRYFLSPDGTTIVGAAPLGSRSVGTVMANNGTSSGSATATIPENTPSGAYYVLACADHAGTVDEINEFNNCLASTNTMNVSSADLTETNVSMSPTMVSTGQTLDITETANNLGPAAAGGSTTRFFFSTDAARGPDDLFVRACVNGDPTPGRLVQAMASGASSTGTTTVPLCVRDNTGSLHAVAPGTYYVIACADETGTVAEGNESNNCGVSSGTFTVADGGADLMVTAISNPPATANLNSSFSVTDTVQNTSASATAGASTTRYFLSLDQLKSGGDPGLTGGRTVPSLAPLATDSGSTTVTVGSGTAAGTYYLLACADGDGAVAEGDENNNCRASATTVAIGGPDLITSQMSNPPATGSPGLTFSVLDRVANIGSAFAGQTITKYYLSMDGINIVGAGPIGQRDVLPLNPGTDDGGNANVTIPDNTPGGSYYIIACADRGFVITENDENNNCRASATTMSISGADLIQTNVSVAPATVAAGGTIDVTETVTNMSTTAAAASVTRYFLSSDPVKSPNDGYMWESTGSGDISHRDVPALAGGQSSTGTTTIPLFVVDAMGHHAIGPGTYYIIACADQRQLIDETNENNNCTASAATFTVTP